MAGEQSEIINFLLKGEVGEQSKRAARSLTCLRLLHYDTEAFDRYIAMCVRTFMHCAIIHSEI